MLELDSGSDTHISTPVFVVGLVKTGTACVKLALEQIRSSDQCLHLDNFITSTYADVDAWIQVVQESDKIIRQEQLRTLLTRYNMAAGVPITSLVEDLLEMYPTAKFILTVRSAETWLATCRSTVLPKHSNGIRQTLLNTLGDRIGLGKLEKLYQLILRRNLGQTTDFNDDNQLLQAYVRWNENIEQLIPKHRLLVFHVKQGWKPLCQFLQVPVPIASPFPEFRQQKWLLKWNKTLTSNMKHLIVCCTAYALFGIVALSWIR
ncbi:unnamed protein product [Echinostoma caproni]|uniref:NAD dependent epimerase/dehydratase n=1 Tax=Echinostoma caproni TaxID=27848 RepID=A0A183ADW2_9TREM|nr:unnamed protein product [Echinostoma caproni]